MDKVSQERGRPLPFRLMLVTRGGLGDDAGLVRALERAVAGGVDAVQVRGQTASGRQLFGLAAAVQASVGAGAKVLVNDRADVALAVGAAGVHLPGAGLPIAAARRLLGPARLIGRSCHRLEQARAAEQEGADYVVFGPVYETPSKREYGPPLGIAALREAVVALAIPVIAIGGITPERAQAARAAGAAGIAVISYLLDHPHPDQAAAALRQAWESGD